MFDESGLYENPAGYASIVGSSAYGASNMPPLSGARPVDRYAGPH